MDKNDGAASLVRSDALLACTVCGQIPDVAETENLCITERDIPFKGWRVRCACPRRCASESKEKAIAIWNNANARPHASAL